MKTRYLFPILFIVFFLFLAYIFSFFSKIYPPNNPNEKDLKIKDINCVST